MSSLLFVCILEALSVKFRIGCPEEMLYANNLVFVCETMDDIFVKLKSWRNFMENKSLRMNDIKTKVMISVCGVGKPTKKKKKIKKFSCSVCGKGVRCNSIFLWYL